MNQNNKMTNDDLYYIWTTNDPRLYSLDADNKLKLINYMIKKRFNESGERKEV